MAADKFLAQFGDASFKSLLEAFEPPLTTAPWRSHPATPKEPQERSELHRTLVEDQQTLQRMKDGEEDGEEEEEEEVDEEGQKEELKEEAASSSSGKLSSEEEVKRAKARARELYRLAKGSMFEADKGTTMEAQLC